MLSELENNFLIDETLGKGIASLESNFEYVEFLISNACEKDALSEELLSYLDEFHLCDSFSFKSRAQICLEKYVKDKQNHTVLWLAEYFSYFIDNPRTLVTLANIDLDYAPHTGNNINNSLFSLATLNIIKINQLFKNFQFAEEWDHLLQLLEMADSVNPNINNLFARLFLSNQWPILELILAKTNQPIELKEEIDDALLSIPCLFEFIDERMCAESQSSSEPQSAYKLWQIIWAALCDQEAINPNQVLPKRKITILMLAIEREQWQLVELLLIKANQSPLIDLSYTEGPHRGHTLISLMLKYLSNFSHGLKPSLILQIISSTEKIDVQMKVNGKSLLSVAVEVADYDVLLALISKSNGTINLDEILHCTEENQFLMPVTLIMKVIYKVVKYPSEAAWQFLTELLNKATDVDINHVFPHLHTPEIAGSTSFIQAIIHQQEKVALLMIKRCKAYPDLSMIFNGKVFLEIIAETSNDILTTLLMCGIDITLDNETVSLEANNRIAKIEKEIHDCEEKILLIFNPFNQAATSRFPIFFESVSSSLKYKIAYQFIDSKFPSLPRWAKIGFIQRIVTKKINGLESMQIKLLSLSITLKSLSNLSSEQQAKISERDKMFFHHHITNLIETELKTLSESHYYFFARAKFIVKLSNDFTTMRKENTISITQIKEAITQSSQDFQKEYILSSEEETEKLFSPKAPT